MKKDKEVNPASTVHIPKEDELKKQEPAAEQLQKKKKHMSVIKAAELAFGIIYFTKVFMLNFHLFDNTYRFGGILEELRPIIFFGGTIIALIFLTKISVNIFGKEKTYGSYLPTAIAGIFIILFFKGCMYFLENWGGGY